MADKNVNTNACKKPTNNSNALIKMVKATEGTAAPNPAPVEAEPATNIRQKNTKITICPASIFAKSRTINTKGFRKTPINSNKEIIGKTYIGTPGIAKICLQ